MLRAGLMASLLMVILAASAVAPSARPVAACSGDAPPLPSERFQPGSRLYGFESGGIALLGQVLTEVPIRGLPTPVVGAPQPVFLSEVKTVTALAGSGATPTVRVGPNGFGAPDCSGGPRLLPGEKVMLFLYPSQGILGVTKTKGEHGDWQSGQFGTPILFDASDAYYLNWSRFSTRGGGTGGEQRERVGSAEEVLRLTLDYFQVTGEQRDAAFRFVLGVSEPAPAARQPSAPRITPPDTGDAGLR